MATGTDSGGAHRLTAGRRLLHGLLVVVWIATAAALPLALPDRAAAQDWVIQVITGSRAWANWITVHAGTFDPGEPSTVTLNLSSTTSAAGTLPLWQRRLQCTTGGTVDIDPGGSWQGPGSWQFQVPSTPNVSGCTVQVQPRGDGAYAGQPITFGAGEVLFSDGLNPTPTPTPAPPTQGQDYWDAPCVNDHLYGPPPPGESHPPLCDDSARKAAVTDETRTQMQARCDSGTSTQEGRVKQGGLWVVSCQTIPGDPQSEGDQTSDDGTNDYNQPMAWYLGEMVEGGPLHLTGYTRGEAGGRQTWCAPSESNIDCETNNTVGGSHANLATSWGGGLSGYPGQGNYAPYRHRTRATAVVSVVNDEGQTDYSCNPWADHGYDIVERHGPGFFSRDGWLCNMPLGTEGDVYLRTFTYGFDDRFHHTEPNAHIEFQRYIVDWGYAVLRDQGHWENNPGSDAPDIGSFWPYCLQTVVTATCRPTVPNTWTDDVYAPPAASGGAEQIPDQRGPLSPVPGEEGEACPISGEVKPGCVPFMTCQGGNFGPVETPDFGCLFGNVGIAIRNAMVDLFMPGDGLGEQVAELGEAFETRAPFGWFSDLFGGVTSALTAPPTEIAVANLCIGGACIGVSPYDFTAGVEPYRGLIFAGVAFFLLVGCLHTIMGAVGAARAPKQMGLGM